MGGLSTHDKWFMLDACSWIDYLADPSGLTSHVSVFK